MKVRMRFAINGRYGTFAKGTEVELPDDIAMAWIEAGAAELADAAPETATVQPPEQAMMPPARSRRGRS